MTQNIVINIVLNSHRAWERSSHLVYETYVCDLSKFNSLVGNKLHGKIRIFYFHIGYFSSEHFNSCYFFDGGFIFLSNLMVFERFFKF